MYTIKLTYVLRLLKGRWFGNQLILWQITNINSLVPLSFFALSFLNELDYRHVNVCDNSDDYSTASCKNLASIRPAVDMLSTDWQRLSPHLSSVLFALYFVISTRLSPSTASAFNEINGNTLASEAVSQSNDNMHYQDDRHMESIYWRWLMYLHLYLRADPDRSILCSRIIWRKKTSGGWKNMEFCNRVAMDPETAQTTR